MHDSGSHGDPVGITRLDRISATRADPITPLPTPSGVGIGSAVKWVVVCSILSIIPVLCFLLLAFFAIAYACNGPGIGDPQKAAARIKGGMAKHEVRGALGNPHRQLDCNDGRSQWDYNCDLFGGTRFRVEFRADERVESTQWWLD